MKTFKFHNANITMTQTGYGQYKLSGLGKTIHCTDSIIYDWCDDESNPKKHLDTRRAAYNLLKSYTIEKVVEMAR